MGRLKDRMARLERHSTGDRHPAPWEPPTPEEVASFLAPVLPIYAACGLLDGPALDEAGIAAVCRAMDWPAPADGPASPRDWALLRAALARCGTRDGGAEWAG